MTWTALASSVCIQLCLETGLMNKQCEGLSVCGHKHNGTSKGPKRLETKNRCHDHVEITETGIKKKTAILQG